MKGVFPICCYMATWEMVMKKSVKKEILGYLKIIAAGVVIAILLNRFVIINADITSESMSTTFEKGDKLSDSGLLTCSLSQSAGI